MTEEKIHTKSYAVIELNFILNDPLYYTMSAPAKSFYIALWCLAVSERSELVRRPSASYIAIMSSSYAPHACRIVAECVSRELIEANEEWIVIFGVSKKHKKISIKEYPNGLKDVPILNKLNKVNRTRVKDTTSAPVKPERELTPIQDFVNFYGLEYEKRFGKKYLPDWGKDGSHIKRALKVLTIEDLKNLLPEFFDDPLDWQGDNPNRTIALFISQINRYGQTNEKVSAGTRKLLGGIAEWYEKTKHLDEGVKHDS
jgi:hypothetical protein